MTKSDTVIQKQNSFKNSTKRILNNRNKYAPIAAYIQSLIKRFRLKTIVEIEEIFNESYIRGLDYIKRENKEIKNIEAFIKRTSLNVIREKRRKQTKHQGIDTNSCQDSIPANEMFNDFFHENFSDSQIESLKVKLRELNTRKPQDFEILWYSVVLDKSAKEVASSLTSKKNKLAASTIRQRKSRTLRKLKEELS